VSEGSGCPIRVGIANPLGLWQIALWLENSRTLSF